MPGYKKTLYTLDTPSHTIDHVETFLVKALNDQLKNKIDEVHQELAFISSNKKHINGVRLISFSEYNSILQVDELTNYLVFFFDPSSSLPEKVYKTIVELKSILEKTLQIANLELVAYDLSITRLPRRFQLDKTFMANTLYFIERISKKFIHYDKKELSGNLLLDFVLRQLSSFGWKYDGNIAAIKFTSEQRMLGFDESVFYEGVPDQEDQNIDL